MLRRKFKLPLLVSLGLLSSISLARSLLSLADWDLNTSGSFKSIVSGEKNRHANVYSRDWVGRTEQRLRLMALLTSPRWTFEYASESSLFYQQPQRSSFTIPDFEPQSFWHAKQRWTSSEQWALESRLDRLSVQFAYRGWEIRIGKQVVPMGVARIFQAVNQIQRRPFLIPDPEFQRTVDAVSVSWTQGWALDVRFMPRASHQTDASTHDFHVRARGEKAGLDVSVTAGRSQDKNFIGIDAAGNWGDALVRAEVVGYENFGRSFLQAIAGWDKALSPSLNFECEAFFNGFGGAANQYQLAPLSHRSSPYRGRFYLGANLAWEMNQRLKWLASGLVNLGDPSALFHLLATYSLAANLDLLAGQFFSVALHQQGEFGGKYPTSSVLPPGMARPELGISDLTYFLVRWYF